MTMVEVPHRMVGQRRARSDGWVAIVNGFGLTLGDSIIGLQALHAALAMGAFPRMRPVLFRLQPERSPLIAELYQAAPHVAAICPQPYRDLGEGPPRQIIDIRDFAFDPGFRRIAMIDYFLHHLGVQPASVPPSLKRNTWLASAVTPRRSPALPQNYVLVCPQAAMTLRVMPDAIHDFILERLAALQPLPVVTQGRPARDRAGRILSVPDCASLPELAGLASGAALIVSTDTAMVHLADALSVPCLAFFTTHRPEWRVRDYPLCRPVHRPARLPEAIEFARGPADIEAAYAAWFGPGDLDWLDAALQQAIAEFITGRSAEPAALRIERRSPRAGRD